MVVAALSEESNGGINGGINDVDGGINDGAKNEVAKLKAVIQNTEGINAEQITVAINK